jgi:hypothetical protein
MLDYEPLDLPRTLAWQTETLPNPTLLLEFIAASRQKPIRPAPPPQRAKTGFQPEHISGFCASA